MRPSWSVAAALRAVRAVLVIPALFAVTLKVVGDPQMTLFAVFGSFAALVMTSFGGTKRDKAVAHLGLAVAGSITLILGTVLSSPTWLAVVGTVPVTFAVFAAGSAGANAASGVSATLLAFVLPIASAGSVGTLPSRLAGWWLAQAASTAAVLLLSARSPGDRLRAQVAALADALAGHLTAAIGGTAGTAPEKVLAAKQELLDTFVGTPYRTAGLAAADHSLANLVHVLEWGAALVTDASDRNLELAAAAKPDLRLFGLSAAGLRDVAALLSGERVTANLEELWKARLASAEHLQRLAGDATAEVRGAEYAFQAQTIGIAVAAALTEAMVVAGAERPSVVAAQRRRWLAGLPATPASQTAEPDGGRSSWLANPVRPAGVIATDASLRSVWFRNSARGAIALAVAVAAAKITGVQHAFWVVLGTLSVLRTSAVATGITAIRALAGTILGFAVGGALLVAIGTDPTALWIIYPFAVLVAAYTPGTTAFAVGQAAFTIVIVILFNLLVPAGWTVGLLRVEDVAIGCAVSLVVGVMFWPRGASAVVGDNVADSFRAGAAYLGDAVGWALGYRDRRPERAVAALAAGARLDDAVRGYLTEQGSKRVTKRDLWTLVMASTRLRLTAHSLASLPDRTAPHGGDEALHAALARQLDELSGFYARLAAEVGRSSKAARTVTVSAGDLTPSVIGGAPARTIGAGQDGYRPDVLWVGMHLDHLEAHAAGIVGPAQRLASVRRRPWWR